MIKPGCLGGVRVLGEALVDGVHHPVRRLLVDVHDCVVLLDGEQGVERLAQRRRSAAALLADAREAVARLSAGLLPVLLGEGLLQLGRNALAQRLDPDAVALKRSLLSRDVEVRQRAHANASHVLDEGHDDVITGALSPCHLLPVVDVEPGAHSTPSFFCP